jgi:hypothetical protein
MAEGKPSREIAAAVGCSVAYVSQLKNDELMKGLIAKQRERVDQIDDKVYATHQARLALIRDMSLDQLINRYHEQPETISHEQARLDFTMASEKLDGPRPAVSYNLHGNLSDIPLAELVALQRARADRLLLEASPDNTPCSGDVSDVSLSGSGPASEPANVPVPASEAA